MTKRKDIFTKCYTENLWHGTTSKSGSGSSINQTTTIIDELPKLFKKLKIKTLLDCPCGDYYWIRHIIPNSNIDNYIGIDIVPEIIKQNKEYANGKISFKCQDLVEDFPQEGDMLLCRDLLVHLSFKSAKKVIKNFLNSNITYLLTTTFDRKENKDYKDGENWYPVNMKKPPFNFPEPILLLNEKCTENKRKYKDKSLGLWRRKDLINSL